MGIVQPLIFVIFILCNRAFAQYFDGNFSTVNGSILEEAYSSSQIEETTKHWAVEKKIKTWVHVCCPPSQYFKSNNCTEGTKPVDDLVFPKIYTADKEPSNLTVDNFQQIYRYPCTSLSFALVPGEDVYYFFENGTIQLLENDKIFLYDQSRYCLAKTSNKALKTIIAVCIIDEHRTPRHLVIYGITCLVSAAFLAATLFVYAVLNELRNHYGIILCTYTLMLMCGQITLGINQVFGQSIFNVPRLCKSMDKRSPAPKKSSEQCGKNELYNTCASGCEKSCDDINNDDRAPRERCASPTVCDKKCVCKDGYVRDNPNNGKCIRLQECPRVKH